MIGNAGGNQPHTNIQPYLTVNFCIALTGDLPVAELTRGGGPRMSVSEDRVPGVPAWLIAVALALVVVGWLSIGATAAHAATFSNSASIALNDPNSQSNGNNNATAAPYPSTISVSGLTGTISNVTLTLSDVTYSFSDDLDVLLVGPAGHTLIPIAAVGPNTGASEAASNSTLTLSDAGTLPTDTTAWGSSSTFKPANFGEGPFSTPTTPNGFNEVFESPAPAGPWGDPGGSGTGATFASQFGGINPNGTWSLYVITTSGGDGTGSIAGGWALNITTASAASTTTTLASSNNPSFTSGSGSSVTLAAAVSSTGTVNEGTVDFTDGGVTISGCGAEPVSNGSATCTTSFSTEGDHSLEAAYAGTSSFGPSNGTLAQEVNDHTTVTGSSYCNTGSVTLNNPAVNLADASPYPSRVFVSGLSGTLSNLTVTLSGVTYSESQDIDALLVGPGGQSLVLVAAAGPNSGGALSNVTLTLADGSATTLAQSAVWGAPGATVTSKPVNYGGLNETWGSPAPSGPYGNPGPSGGGSATLGNTFDGINPDGTWSLYLITTAAGDGTGSIAGGWCANVTAASAAATTTTLTSNNNPSFTSGSGSSVTLAAAVSSAGTVNEGTVDFTDGGSTIPGCGARAVTNGTATCTTTFSTEGDHSLEAAYAGTSSFGPSNATLSQEVDDHTTVSANSFCNTGSVTLNNPAVTLADASPYPSHVFVAGKAGNLTGLTVTLNSVSYSESQDIDALLVGPGGQSLILVAAAGPNSGGALSNVTLTLDDAAPTTLAQSAVWGAPGATVTSKPVNYGGLNETWGSPAPSAPYGNPGPFGGGSATLGSTFDGTSANGTWSLYLITTTAGDGTGAVAGGWCVTPTVPKTTLTVGTQVSPASTTIGDSGSDTATLSGVPNGATAPTGTVTFNAYGPNDATCSGAPAFTATTSLSGSGTTASSGAFTPTTAGTYRWTAAYGGDSNYSSVTTNCNDTNETLAVATVAPSITTTASSGVPLGGNIGDSAVLSGGVNPTGTITFDAYGPNDLTCSNTPAFTGAVTVNGNGTYASSAFTPTGAGTYEFVATYNGDANNASTGSSCGAAGESVVVAAAAPSITTAASSGVPLGGNIGDSAVLSGGVNPTGTITFDVYGPNDLTCSNTPAFTGAVTVNGNGTYASSAFTPTGAGTYEFVATYRGDGNNASAGSSCGAAGESVVVAQVSPTLTAQASSTVAAGGQISDTATLAGGSLPTGSITYKLFGPNNSACTGTPIFTSTISSVSGNGDYVSPPFTTSAVGTYNWVVTYSGDANNVGATVACGAANSSVVTAATTQTTLVSSLNPAIVGQAITFTATVAGANPTGTVTFMDGSGTLGTGALAAGGTATLAISSLTAASHSVTAVYSGDANNTGSTSNALTEVVNIPPPLGAPSVSITSPTAGVTYRSGQVVRARYSCTEGANGPGIQSCTGPVPNGAPIDTSKPGAHSFAVTAVSQDGQSTTSSVAYTVTQNNQFTVSAVIARANGTITFQLEVPTRGVVNVLETAWASNVAHVASLLQPAKGRFVFARARVSVRRAGSITVTVKPGAAGRKLLAHHTYSPVLRLWLSFTPSGGSQRNFGFYGLHLPSSPSAVEKCMPANLPGRITHEPLRCRVAPA